MLFWGGVLVLGVIVVGSGLVLDKLIPGLAYTRGDMQVAHMVHAVAAMLMMALFLGHIYSARSACAARTSAMRDGYVDEGWAEEHHAYWYDDIAAGKIPAQRSSRQTAAARQRPAPDVEARTSPEPCMTRVIVLPRRRWRRRCLSRRWCQAARR